MKQQKSTLNPSQQHQHQQHKKLLALIKETAIGEIMNKIYFMI